MDNDTRPKRAASPAQAPKAPPPLIIKADELDSTGTDVSMPVPDALTPITPALEVPPVHPPRSLSPQSLSGSPRPPSIRPILRREGSTPAPRSQPPSPTPQEQQQASDPDSHNTDSLSLQQLRQLVTNLPKLEPQAYAYEHADTRSFPEEVEEWFPYSEEERYMHLRGKEVFEAQWERQRSGCAFKWTEAGEEDRERFVQKVVERLNEEEEEVEGIECLAYLAMGCWGETAGLQKDPNEEPRKGSARQGADKNQWGGFPQGQWTQSSTQIHWIRRGCELLVQGGAVKCAFDVLRRACDGEQDADEAADAPPLGDEEHSSVILHRFLALNQALTVLYLIVEVGRWGPVKVKSEVREVIMALEPGLLQHLTKVIAQTRWQDTPRLPFTRLLLLYWKVILLAFGTSEDLKHCKKVLRNDSDSTKNDDQEGFITASPLDYHLFRQEITSKYPAYNPPPPLIPIELENNTILPPLPNHPSRRTSQENLTTTSGPTANGTPGSIFNQPVHIATPAPSPPPSPAGPGGKGGKKQNYQTNQNFPFLYPPLDETSNVIGGKGSTGLPDQLIGKRWEGSDVPASILEAGQLFASRMRMSRSLRQLWDVRERFIRHERGWDEAVKDTASDGSSGSMIDETVSDEIEGNTASADQSSKEEPAAAGEQETSDEDVQRRLDAIEGFYRNALPHLQSVVLVLWKIVFTNVSYMAAQANGTNGLGVPNGIAFPEDNPEKSPVRRRINVRSAGQDGMVNGHPADFDEDADPVLEELNSMRLREISSKAISAILLMLLKWFKLSHILKYEYLTQLLLDANFLPLILKYFAHQDVDRAVDAKTDREELNFFHSCHVHSNQPPSPKDTPPSPSPSSPDSAAPPPIPTHRRSRSNPSSNPPSPSPPLKPSVDELGYPTGPLPTSPLTSYSPRFFYTTTTLLRLLQKITKNHAHRSLLLVQYKSSTILRRHLKIPQPELRLYTLKLFKHQVPFCGRKWRQSNMRVITAVYLHVGCKLRDEWLAGGDVDGVVEEAVPVEQGWRALVHWWHLREYRDEVEGTKLRERDKEDGRGDEVGVEDGEKDVYDFFARELEKMGWGAGGASAQGSVHGDEEEEGGAGEEGGKGGSEWDGGPLQLEGWA